MEFSDDTTYRTITKLDNNTYSAYALAKLNITLSIGKKESNGFHNISSVMQTISLCDMITLKRVEIGKGGMEGRIINENLVETTIENLSTYVNKKLSCRISISKAIPIFAGLGGGSSDAAAVLRIANKAFNLELKLEELDDIASGIGNDVPFLLHGGRATVNGSLKHKIKQITSPNLYYAITRPKLKLNTRDMYNLHDKTGKTFTELASEICSDTKKLIEELKRSNPTEIGVTGKGPTVFAGYKTYSECKTAINKLLWFDGEIFIETSVGQFI